MKFNWSHAVLATAFLSCSPASFAYDVPTQPAPGGPGRITAECACADLVDRITILEIKLTKFTDETKLSHARIELESLRETRDKCLPQSAELDRLTDELRSINLELWNTEDAIRAKERDQAFDDEFIGLARNVYKTNDKRNQTKHAINNLCVSRIIEAKQFPEGYKL